jgi:elongation factor Ts
MSSIEVVKEVRNRSHASLKDCAVAVDEAGGDVDKALKLLQEKGIISAAGRAKVANEGRVQSYVHGADARLTVVVEVNCETDFAARSDSFKEFCDTVAMQIAAMNPKWVRREDVPAEVVAEQRRIYEVQLTEQKKPQAAWPKIVEGKIEKWLSEACLLEHKAVASTTPEETIERLRALLSSKLGETITIRRFVRWEVGEGIEKPKKADYATEVAELSGV